MNKEFLGKNSVRSLGIFLLVAILFSGCPKPSDNSSAVENAQANKAQTPTDDKAAPSSANTGASQNAEVLWDFRKNDFEKPPQFSKAESEAVLKYLLGDKWDPELAITSRVSGAFTKQNAKETLYFITGCKDESGKFISNSTCGHVAWNTAGWIAVYDGTTPVMKIEEALGSGIEKVTDINGDGINEFASFGGYTGMGIVTTSGGLGQLSGGKYQEIKSFRGWAEDCANTFSKDKKAVAAVVSYVPTSGGKPEFSEEHFQTKCEGDSVGKSPQWNKITKKQFDDFFESIS